MLHRRPYMAVCVILMMTAMLLAEAITAMLLPEVLAPGPLLNCGVTPPATARLLHAHAGGEPELPRSFSLPNPLFAPDGPWNRIVAQAAVLPASDRQILVTYRVLLGDDSTLSPGTEPPNWPYMDVNYDDYAIPVFQMGAGQLDVLICDYDGSLGWTNPKLPIGEEGGPVTVPAPAGTVRPAGPQDTDADGHLVLYDPDTLIEYDFWQATTALAGDESLGGGRTGPAILRAGMIDFFDVDEPGANPDTYSSARATGVPLLAGLIVPEDVERADIDSDRLRSAASGAISHALAVAIPGLRNTNAADPSEPLSSDYFYPASTTETDFYNTHPYALAAGQRIRLKRAIVDAEGQPIDESRLAPITRMFLMTLRVYGAIVVDNAGGFTFYAEDIHTADLHLTDDEVNELVGQPSGTSLPGNKTKWQVAIETLNTELEQIPIAYGGEGQDPAAATFEIANFEVVAPCSVYLPLVLR